MRDNLLMQPVIDISGMHITTVVKNNEVHQYLFSALKCFNDPMKEINLFIGHLDEFFSTINELVTDPANILRRKEYEIIIYPIIMGRKVGSYAPLPPLIRYSFYARNRMTVRKRLR